MSRTIQVTFDAHDPAALATFWREAPGYEFPPPPGVELAQGEDPLAAWDTFLESRGVPPDERNNASALEDPEGTGPRLFFQRVPEGKVAKNRVHLDVRAAPGLQGEERMAALGAECDRLVALGATRLQAFGSISMRAEAARNVLASGDTAKADHLLTSIGDATEGALAEVRRLIDDLGPAALHDHDLVPALQTQLAAYSHRFPVTLDVHPDPLPPLEEKVAATAYLVISEAVRNAARHSSGSGATVRVRMSSGWLRVEVQDDGRGLGDATPGVGRSGMAARVEEEGGRLTVEDGEPSGTIVRFELPGALR